METIEQDNLNQLEQYIENLLQENHQLKQTVSEITQQYTVVCSENKQLLTKINQAQQKIKEIIGRLKENFA